MNNLTLEVKEIEKEDKIRRELLSKLNNIITVTPIEEIPSLEEKILTTLFLTR
jgi:hypothetical protein